MAKRPTIWQLILDFIFGLLRIRKGKQDDAVRQEQQDQQRKEDDAKRVSDQIKKEVEDVKPKPIDNTKDPGGFADWNRGANRGAGCKRRRRRNKR